MKKKSQFLSSFGTAFQILKTLADSVLDIGGNDDDMRRILVDVDLRRDLATRIVGSRNKPTTQTSHLDAALEHFDAREAEIERPKRQEESDIHKFTEEYWAWAQSDEGRKSAKLLEKSRANIKSALDAVMSSHLRNHPNLDSCMPNWSISMDREACLETVKWWYEYRRWEQAASCVEFVRHQMKLIAELPQLPYRNPDRWLTVRVRNAFGTNPDVTIRTADQEKGMRNSIVEIKFKDKFLGVKFDTEGFHFFDSPDMVNAIRRVFWKEEAFGFVSKFLTQ